MEVNKVNRTLLSESLSGQEKELAQKVVQISYNDRPGRNSTYWEVGYRVAWAILGQSGLLFCGLKSPGLTG